MSLLKVTDKALERMKNLLSNREQEPFGLKFATEEKGCSGLSYVVDYAEARGPGDELIEIDGVNILIPKESLMFLLGSTIDYEEGKFSSGFVFINPNEKSRCGCGESFNV